MIYRRFIKRLLDVVLALCAMLLLSPLFIVIALLVWWNIGTPIIFKQRRPGHNERIFTIYKFRTMGNTPNEEEQSIRDEDRLTEFGVFLRSTSLDEIPELLNILRGDMSFVGPRPLLEDYLPLYNEYQRRRHSVKPGLTGLAQVKGRNRTTWNERFHWDVKYIEDQSFALDFKILLKTFVQVIEREGIDSGTSLTMEPFAGNTAPDENGESSSTDAVRGERTP